MDAVYGQRIPDLTIRGREVRAGVFNENEVRAAAGMTMVIGAVAFVLALTEQIYVPLQLVTIFFFIEFTTRVTLGLQHSPLGVVSRVLVRRLEPEWVSARPKRFAWSLGVVLSFAMVIITNTGIRGALPATLCSICLTLMWMESALGLCAGCELYAFLRRRGWIAKDEEIEICAGGVCEAPRRPAPGQRSRNARPSAAPEPARPPARPELRLLGGVGERGVVAARPPATRPPRKLTSTLLTSPSPNSA